ncbi:hypothetical protein AAFF_G00428990 [Aldrovandia affinis]|uniref:Uncharacterized protein n=1 Tax=Aldrovandia affinis TaxID=143900 RepID=A0AAD7S9A1_9TELE|nr:hypothetical protein AAFF_G00428990 [Aldrovandia affinis]
MLYLLKGKESVLRSNDKLTRGKRRASSAAVTPQTWRPGDTRSISESERGAGSNQPTLLFTTTRRQCGSSLRDDSSSSSRNTEHEMRDRR